MSSIDNDDLKDITVSNHVKETTQFPEFWAILQSKGNTLGNNFIEAFQPLMKKWVYDGALEKSKMMSPSQMKEKIIKLHPDSYNIPSTHHINNYVNALLTTMRKEKKAGKRKENGKTKRKARYNMPVKYSQDMEELVLGNFSIAACDIGKELMLHMGISENDGPEDFPDETRLVKINGVIEDQNVSRTW